jgi:hypothetical protein
MKTGEERGRILMRSVISLTILLFYGSLWLGAQELHGSSTPGSADLLPGLGSHHHPIATKNAEAQKLFDEGLILNFSFNHGEAVRSFRRAIELDPEAAMPYWGVACFRAQVRVCVTDSGI